MGADVGHLPDGAALRSDIPTAPTTDGPCWACRSGRHGECTGVACWHCPPANHRRDGWPHIVTDLGGHQ